MKVGDVVTATVDVYEHPSGDSPGGYCCRKGETLIVRKVASDGIGWPLHVSHKHITNNSFGVHLHEVELKGGAT